MLKKLYTRIVHIYAHLAYPAYPHIGILYLKQNEQDGHLVDYLVVEKIRDTDLVFHPVQRWLKGLVDEREALLRENSELKARLIEKEQTDGNKA